MDAEGKTRRPPQHRYPGYKWHPRGDLYERLIAFAEANGLLRSEALDQVVADGLKVNGGTSVGTDDGCDDHLAVLQSALGRVVDLQQGLDELALRLDLLGATALTVTHAIASSTALDPANQDIGENREMVEERVLDEIFEASRSAWGILRPSPESNTPPKEDQIQGSDVSRELLGQLLAHWTNPGSGEDGTATASPLSPSQRARVRRWARGQGLDPGRAVQEMLDLMPSRHRGSIRPAKLAPSNRQRLSLWARTRGVTVDVALNALVDMALTQAESSNVLPPWAVGEVLRAQGTVEAALSRVERAVQEQAHLVDRIGSLFAGVPYLVVRWCSEDENVDDDFEDGGDRAGVDREERLRLAFARDSEELWRGQVEGLLEERAIDAGIAGPDSDEAIAGTSEGPEA